MLHCRLQKGSIFITFCHHSSPIIEPYLRFVFLSNMISFEVAIGNKQVLVHPSLTLNKLFNSCQMGYFNTHLLGSFFQSNGKFMAGWGQAGQKLASWPGASAGAGDIAGSLELTVVCPLPAHLSFFIHRHTCDNCISSWYKWGVVAGDIGQVKRQSFWKYW